MTLMGLIFAVAYVGAFMYRRAEGVLVVAAVAIPFNDSAAILAGPATFSPFYLGMIAFIPLAIVSDLHQHKRPRVSVLVPGFLWFWTVVTTLIAPSVFAGTQVFASGVGLDAQVASPSTLSYSSSNVAQVVYLTLNLAFVLFSFQYRQAIQRLAIVAALAGTSVASAAWLLGQKFPHAFFDNSPRELLVPTPRLRAQFSEPSHLGAFAATAMVLLAFYSVVNAKGLRRGLLLLVALLDCALVLESQAVTALAGAAIFLVAFPVIWVWRSVRSSNHIKIPVGVLYATLGAVLILLLTRNIISGYVADIIDYKHTATTESLSTRSATNGRAWQIFKDTFTFGVGIGSNRSSSLALLLLSTIGLVGTASFILMLWRSLLAAAADTVRLPSVAALITLVGAAATSFADFVSPMMWVLIAVGWHAYSVEIEAAGAIARRDAIATISGHPAH